MNAATDASPLLQKFLGRKFEDHTRDFILRAQQRFEERRRKDAKIMSTSSSGADASASLLPSGGLQQDSAAATSSATSSLLRQRRQADQGAMAAISRHAFPSSRRLRLRLLDSRFDARLM